MAKHQFNALLSIIGENTSYVKGIYVEILWRNFHIWAGIGGGRHPLPPAPAPIQGREGAAHSPAPRGGTRDRGWGEPNTPCSPRWDAGQGIGAAQRGYGSGAGGNTIALPFSAFCLLRCLALLILYSRHLNQLKQRHREGSENICQLQARLILIAGNGKHLPREVVAVPVTTIRFC